MTQPLKVLDLFAGIGGFSLGLERTGGFETVAFCEIDKYCQKILAKHWPDVPVYSDVRLLDGSMFSNVDVIVGGFPCQDIAVAGRQAGIEGKRSGLWDDLCRLIGEIRPQYAIVENVSNLLNGPTEQRGEWFGKVLGDLAEVGFDAEWHCIPASAVGAPHIRDRVWIVAYPQHSNTDSAGPHRTRVNVNGETEPADKQIRFAGPLGEILADARSGLSKIQRHRNETSQQKQGCCCGSRNPQEQDGELVSVGQEDIGSRWRIEPRVGRVAYGVPKRVDRLRSLGNAVIPQIPELIGRAILQRLRTTANAVL